MDLLPLPHFYHIPMAITLLLALLTIWLIKRKKRPKLNFNDPYALTRALKRQKQTKETAELLKELENYKYSPNPPKLPKLLKKRIQKVLQ